MVHFVMHFWLLEASNMLLMSFNTLQHSYFFFKVYFFEMRSLFNLPLSLLTHILRRHTCSMVSHLQVFCAIFKLLHLHCVGRPEPQDGTDLREPGPSASGLPRMEEQERCSSTILQNGVSNSERIHGFLAEPVT